MTKLISFLTILFLLCLSNFCTVKNIKNEGISPAPNYLGYDIELFEGTPVENVSLMVKTEDTIEISNYFNRNQNIKEIDFKENKFGFTLLFWAVFNHKLKSAKALLKLGANPNILSKDGTSQLIKASRYDNIELMQMLIDYGANVNYIRDTLYPASAFSASLPKHNSDCQNSIQKINLLIESGGNINIKNAVNATALSEAVICDCLDVIELLVYNNADVNVPVFIYPNGKIIYFYEMLLKYEVEPEENERKEKLLKYVSEKIKG